MIFRDFIHVQLLPINSNGLKEYNKYHNDMDFLAIKYCETLKLHIPYINLVRFWKLFTAFGMAWDTRYEIKSALTRVAVLALRPSQPLAIVK